MTFITEINDEDPRYMSAEESGGGSLAGGCSYYILTLSAPLTAEEFCEVHEEPEFSFVSETFADGLWRYIFREGR